MNIRSLLSKIDELRYIAIKSKATIICITETWLDETVWDTEISIPEYNILRKDRNRDGGGVCMYIRSDIAHRVRIDFQHPELETVWAEILLPKTRPILVGTCYRPPKQMNFYDLMEQCCIDNNRSIAMETILIGDFNTNIDRCNNNYALTRKLKEFSDTCNFTQLIKDYTRVTDNSRTTIDLILTSDYTNISQSGVTDIGLSDHCMIYCTRKLKRDYIAKHNNVTFRSMKDYSKAEFILKLSEVNWNCVLQCEDVNVAWNSFKTVFVNIIDSLAPMKRARFKQRSEPWFDETIANYIKIRDQLLSEFKKSNCSTKFTEYKKVRNYTQRLIENSKKDYYKNKLENDKNVPKKLWKTLKDLGTSRKSKSSASSIGLKVDDQIIFDKPKVADKFNTCFTTVASNLVKSLPAGTGKYCIDQVEKFYISKGVSEDSFELYPVCEEQVRKLLTGINSCKATGLDNIPAKFVTDASEIITSPLTHIINLSLSQGIMPDELKNARVVPIYKKNSNTDVGNYRPVSVLNVISKVFERLVHDQLHQYMHDMNLLYEYQSGFRNSYSTDTCLMHLTDYIKLEMDKGNYVGMILLDLQKAFDKVNHDILLGKMKTMGCSNSAVKWFRSYLSDRKQLTDLSGTRSELDSITCGVPQGSILGPLLFLMYVNDMEIAVHCKLILYADDSALLIPGRNLKDIEKQLSIELSCVNEWLVDNKLSLHLGKTESILFGQKRKIKNKSLRVVCNDTKISSSSRVKYLGAELDQSLDGEEMARKVVNKVYARIKFLYRKSQFLDTNTRKLLAAALVQCHYDYACSFWYSGLTKRTKSKLQISQNKLIRFTLNLQPRKHLSSEHFKSLGWLPIEQRVEQLKLNHVYRVLGGTAPSYLSGRLTLNNHSHNTRSSQSSLVIPHHGTYGKSAFCITGAKLWNSLPASIKNSPSLVNFKKKVKAFLYDKMVSVEQNEFILY